MRVVQYYPRALVGDGGISNSIRHLSAAMVRVGAEVIIAHQPGLDTQGLATDGGNASWIPVKHLTFRGFNIPLDLDAALEGADVLILNSAWTSYNVWAATVARKRGVPYVVADRGGYDPLILQRRRWMKRVWWRLFEHKVVRNASALHVFFESQEPSRRVIGYEGKVIVAPNGVSVPPGVVWDGGSGGYLLYIGRFDPEHKGLDLLVNAVKKLPERDRPVVRMHGPDWRGGKERVETLIADLDLQEWFHVGGPVYGCEKWNLLAAAGGFVYPSRWEAFGNSPAEAAAVGVPLLVTDYPLGRYLESQGAAIRTQASVAAMTEGLRQLTSHASDPGNRRNTLAEKLTWDSVAEAWLTQLEGLSQ